MNPFSNLLRYLQSNAVPFVVDGIPSIPEHVEPRTLSALADVRRARVTPIQVDRQVWLAIVEESRQLRPDLVRRAFGGRTVTNVHDEDLSLLFPQCAATAVPPLGNLFGLPVMIDEALSDAPAVSFAAFSPEVSIAMRTSDLRELSKPVVAEISAPSSVSASLA
ncbi:MAG: YbaK/EbsC family protein [Bacteroidetes bacterium]|jgi:Ala-tRNA(Pro) deacylase|nr:YbaK/EbsC family protein [Bacteroidota bacterium]